MNELPLSWSISSNKETEPIKNKIKLRNLTWLAFQQVNQEEGLINKISSEVINRREKFLIRGCNKNQKENLNELGFTAFQFGMEAILDMNKNPFIKKSLKELVKRGLRNGHVNQLPYSSENQSKLELFQKQSAHSSFPQLENLFQNNFTKQNILYVFINKDNNWLGAVLVSNNSDKKLHTELIIRRKDTPIGVMEALIYKVFTDAKLNNIEELSLGEVPFIFKSSKNLFTNMLKRISSFLKFAYNYKGLYNFKNKFQPRWEPLYICSTNRNKLFDVFLIFHRSHFSNLLFHKLVYSLKN